MPTRKTKTPTTKRRATTDQKLWPKLYWFVHHEVPVEWVDDLRSLRERISYIKRYKRQSEVPNRLRAMKVVLNRTPELSRLAMTEYTFLRPADKALLRRQLRDEYPLAPVEKRALRVKGT